MNKEEELKLIELKLIDKILEKLSDLAPFSQEEHRIVAYAICDVKQPYKRELILRPFEENGWNEWGQEIQFPKVFSPDYLREIADMLDKKSTNKFEIENDCIYQIFDEIDICKDIENDIRRKVENHRGNLILQKKIREEREQLKADVLGHVERFFAPKK